MSRFELIPAIDLLGGKCVRLTQGDYGAATEYDADPAAVAARFAAHGIQRLHVVDLDGAKRGEPVNAEATRAHSRRSKGHPGRARRRHSHARGHRGLARPRRRARDPRHRRAARSRAGARSRATISWAHRRRHRRTRRQGRRPGLARDERDRRADTRAPLRRRRRRRDHLHRHRARRHRHGPEPRRDGRARARGLDPRDRVWRRRLARRRARRARQRRRRRDRRPRALHGCRRPNSRAGDRTCC